MTKFIYALGDMFESVFSILPSFGPVVNTALFMVGFVGIVGWIWYMTKTAGESK
jgi:hypothetical protein